MNIKKAMDECLGDLQVATTTEETYRQGMRRFIAYLCERDLCEDSPVQSLTMEHFIFFYTWVGKHFAKSTGGVYSAAAKAFLDWMVIHNIIDPSYKDMLRLEKAHRNTRKRRESKLPRFPQRDDVNKMIQAAKKSQEPRPRYERNLAIVEFLASTGCRVNEVVSLKIKDLDMDNHSVVVTGKGSKDRRVWFSTAAADALKTYWQVRGYDKPAQPVFARHDRRVSLRTESISTDTARMIVKMLKREAGVDKFSPHYFRHAFAIRVLSETKNLALVQDLLGHSNPASTRVYAKIYSEDLQSAHQDIFK